jgi:phage tail-like protein
MDANGTKFHLLLGKQDWGRATPGASEWAQATSLPLAPLAELWEQSAETSELTGLRWDSRRNELTLAPQLFQFPPSRKDRPPGLTDRRGAGRDRYGNWYWIAEDEREILVNSAGSGSTSHFWSASDCVVPEAEGEFGGFSQLGPAPAPPELRFRGLALTEDHFLVAGVLKPAGLLIFDLHAGGGPIQMIWPEAVDFTPFDFAARPGGGVVILDRDLANATKPPRYWVLDRRFNVEVRNQIESLSAEGDRGQFRSLLGEAQKPLSRPAPTQITAEAAVQLVGLDAIAIEALPDNSVLILDRNAEGGFSRIWRYSACGRLEHQVSVDPMKAMIKDVERAAFTLVAHDFAFVPEHETNEESTPDRVYIVEQKGNQAFAFDIALEEGQLKLDPLPDYLPMRLFGGKGLVAGGGRAYYDFSDRWIPLVEQPRPRFEEAASVQTPALDGGEPDCRWHRLMVDACFQPESKVEVWSRAANDEVGLAFTEWRPEPALYRRGDGSELPFVSIKQASPAVATEVRYTTWELLLQRARGRFIQIKLRLSGNGRTTPRIRAMRVYYPQFSYLDHYLPAIYREDEQSASFLDRFLANVEGFYTSIEDKIAAAQVLFDVRSAPREHLDWLAGWFGIALDPSWDEARRRLFIGHAMDFFQYRGTVRGLKAALRLAFDRCVDESVFDVSRSLDHRRELIRIIESYRARRTPGAVIGAPDHGLPLAEMSARWQPNSGRSDLYQRYADFLRVRFSTTDLPAVISFSLRNYDWQRLAAEQAAGVMIPTAEPVDLALWRAFLERRYSTIAALNAAHSTNFTNFSAVTIPASLQAATAALRDWDDFVVEKSAAWRDFAQRSLDFVPQSAARERSLWAAFLTSRYQSVSQLNSAYGAAYPRIESAGLPVKAPAPGARLADWEEFKRATAGTPASAMRTRWQDFLARRYRRVGALNAAYGTDWGGFDDISLFDELPLGQAALADWYQFEAVVLRMHDAAHRFTVLLPAPKDRAGRQAEFQRQRELATRIVSWEKPAHTVFDVKFYWAMFRVGAARLGFDTLLDVGSRAPELLSPMVLGQGYLAESYLADYRDRTGRQILACRRLGQAQAT